MKWLDSARVRLRLLFARRTAESRMNDEFRFHLEMETDQLMRVKGLAPDEARRQALAAFGGVEKHKEALRDGRGLAWLGGMSLDCKLGIRMLLKYPGLTIVGGLAMAFGICAGVGGYEILRQFVDPVLPLEDGRRIVGIRSYNVRTRLPFARTAYDFARWRQEITLINDFGAFTAGSANVVIDVVPEPTEVAHITASGFRVARVPPLIGRTLVDADETDAAPPVVVIGYDLWQRRFSADPAILGRMVQLGREYATVVGVMPEGFAFPVSHSLWLPLRRSTLDVYPAEGPELLVFGRLAPGVTIDQAQAELMAASRRTAADAPGTHEFVQPQVIPFASLIIDPRDFEQVRVYANGFLVMLLALACSNVGLLVFARTATRHGEIAVRNALGASRRRIVGQLFVEALVLSLLAVTVGLVAARLALSSYWSMYAADSGRPLPFWLGIDFAPATMMYAGVLTVVAAVIIGVMPALKVTGSGRLAQLRQSTAGGGGDQFGGAWTAVIVTQVAMTLAFPVVGFHFHRWVVLSQTRDLGFPAQEFLSARLVVDPDVPSDRSTSTYAELGRRLAAEPGIHGVTFADRLPGTQHERLRVELDGDTTPPSSGYRVHVASVDLDFFQALGAAVQPGRPFTAADSRPDGARTTIVNASFVADVMKGRNPLGQRIRRLGRDGQPAGPWLEIVGVVPDLGIGTLDEGGSGIYAVLDPSARDSVAVAVHVRGTPESFVSRLRIIANEVAPTMAVHDAAPLDRAGAAMWLESQYIARLLMVMSAMALLLSLTAIYSVMAATVAHRTREIGIRLALGAPSHRVLAAVFRRPFIQVALGVAAGAAAAALIAYWMSFGLYGVPHTADQMLLVVPYSAGMMAVCLVACVVPVRRALSLAPAEVLTADA